MCFWSFPDELVGSSCVSLRVRWVFIEKRGISQINITDGTGVVIVSVSGLW